MTKARRLAAPRMPRVAVALASAAALAYEVLLLRLFAITQWHHTAYMVISLALLGYGASGSLLAWRGGRWRERFERVFPRLLTLAAVAMVACFLVGQRIPVHPDELLWSPLQGLRLTLVYLLLCLPFLCVATAIGLAFLRFRPQAVYASDLLGAGLGALLAVGLLYLLHPSFALRATAALALVAAWCCDLESGAGWRRRRAVSAALLALLALAPASWTAPEMSQYKGLRQLLRIDGAFVAHERSGPLALVTAVESPRVPLRHAPGLGLTARREPPEQVALVLDGDALTVVTRTTGGSDSLDYLHRSTAALPYHLRPPSSVLVLGAGAGEQLLRGRLHGAESIVAVEIDRNVIEMARDLYGDWSERLLEARGVDVVIAEARGFVAREARRFDLVEHATSGGPSGSGPGVHALAESYLYTVEAVFAYLERVAPGGYLALTGWVTTPPRGTLKMAATVLEALRRDGIDSPERRIAVVRGWQTSTILVKRGELEPSEIEAVWRFCRDAAFDVVFVPGMAREGANRYNRLRTPAFHDGLVALIGDEREAFLRRSKFALAPATDDRPFFHQFFRWRALPEIVALRGRGGLPLLDAGYLVLVATLLQGLVLALLVVGLPAWLLTRRAGVRRAAGSRRIVPYFGGLGLAFLLVEVAFLQKLMLLLHHPVLTAAVVLSGFLVFAGIGSAMAGRLGAEPRWAASRATVLIVGFGLLALAGSAVAVSRLVGAPAAVRVVAALALIAPLAAAMGVPFPAGLQALRRADPAAVPWAWGVNGCAAVVAPVLGTLLAVHLGFTAVVLLGLLVYTATTAVFPVPSASGASAAASSAAPGAVTAE